MRFEYRYSEPFLNFVKAINNKIIAKSTKKNLKKINNIQKTSFFNKWLSFLLFEKSFKVVHLKIVSRSPFSDPVTQMKFPKSTKSGCLASPTPLICDSTGRYNSFFFMIFNEFLKTFLAYTQKKNENTENISKLRNIAMYSQYSQIPYNFIHIGGERGWDS